MSVVEDTNKRTVPACPGDFKLACIYKTGQMGLDHIPSNLDNGLSGTSVGHLTGK